MRKAVDRPYVVSVALSQEELSWLRELAQIERVTEERVLRRAGVGALSEAGAQAAEHPQGDRHRAGGSGGLKARSARLREPRGRRAGEWVSGIAGWMKTEQVKQRLESSSSRWAFGRRKCSVSLCSALRQRNSF
jgi:hypothetical protein